MFAWASGQAKKRKQNLRQPTFKFMTEAPRRVPQQPVEAIVEVSERKEVDQIMESAVKPSVTDIPS